MLNIRLTQEMLLTVGGSNFRSYGQELLIAKSKTWARKGTKNDSQKAEKTSSVFQNKGLTKIPENTWENIDVEIFIPLDVSPELFQKSIFIPYILL